jgi:hypothetical protein
MQKEMEKALAMRINGTKTIKGLSAQKKRETKILKDLLRRIDNAVHILTSCLRRSGKSALR